MITYNQALTLAEKSTFNLEEEVNTILRHLDTSIELSCHELLENPDARLQIAILSDKALKNKNALHQALKEKLNPAGWDVEFRLKEILPTVQIFRYTGNTDPKFSNSNGGPCR